MTKNEYLSQLLLDLNKRKIADSAEIVSEYEQHFAFKLADGFSEEEIAAKLGNPAALAATFEAGTANGESGGRKVITMVGLSFADFFAGIFFILLFAWELIMAAFSLVSATIAVCLLLGLNPQSLIPPIPYGCGIIFALAFAALAVLAAVGCLYFTAFIRQLMRSFGRFHHNSIAFASGQAMLPRLAIHPQLPAKMNRRIRSVALVSIVVFAVCCILGFTMSIIASGAIEFWHAWNWFVS